MTKQPIITFPLLSSKGIEKIPNETFIYIECQQKFYLKVSSSNKIIQETTTIIFDHTYDQVNSAPQTSDRTTWTTFWTFFPTPNPTITLKSIDFNNGVLPDTTYFNDGSYSTKDVDPSKTFYSGESNWYGWINVEGTKTYSYITTPTIQQAIDTGMIILAGTRVCPKNFKYFKVIRKNLFEGVWYNDASTVYSISQYVSLKITRVNGGDGSSIPEGLEITLYEELPYGESAYSNADPYNILCVSSDQSTITTEFKPPEVIYKEG